MKDCKYITFEQNENYDDTWDVYAKKDRAFLGFVEWYTPWKGFIFEPKPETIYEAVCLTDIADFIRELNTLKKSEGGKQ